MSQVGVTKKFTNTKVDRNKLLNSKKNSYTLSESLVRNSSHQVHPNHEDEVILRRKLREEKVELEDNNSEDAPIVPVLR